MGAYIKKYSAKRLASKKIEQEQSAAFFDKAITHFEQYPFSMEGGEYIPNIGRINVAHLWPKRTYKSVQHNLDNVILLTPQQHTDFDNYLDRMDFERLEREFVSWNLIREQMIELLPTITERGNLYLRFTEYVENLRM